MGYIPKYLRRRMEKESKNAQITPKVETIPIKPDVHEEKPIISKPQTFIITDEQYIESVENADADIIDIAEIIANKKPQIDVNTAKIDTVKADD